MSVMCHICMLRAISSKGRIIHENSALAQGAARCSLFTLEIGPRDVCERSRCEFENGHSILPNLHLIAVSQIPSVSD